MNCNENSDPEDMVSTRLWIDDHRIISVQKRHLSAIDDVVEEIHQRRGPRNSAEFLVMLTQNLMKTTATEVEIRTMQVDQIEDEIFDNGKVSPQEKVSVERRKNPDIGSTFDQMGCEGVPQGMRRNLKFSRATCPLNKVPDTLPAKPPTLLI